LLAQAEAFIATYLALGRCAFLTCGHWDLKSMLAAQASMLGIKLPSIWKSWINVKVCFNEYLNKSARDTQSGMAAMLSALKLRLIGHHHSGIDDARNIARIAIELLARKPEVLQINGSVK
jgi:ERI1 exoribonuclease 3